MIGVFLFAGLCAAYIGGACFFRKKGKPSIWNSLVFGGVMLLLAMICRRNYLFRLPSLEYKSSIMIMIYASLPALVAGYYGSYMKEGMAYKWNTLFIRPLVIDLGFAGLALPYLHDISVMRKGFMVGVIPLTVGMIVVIVAEVILNMADREYKMTLRRQIIYDMLFISLNTLLAVVTSSVWLTVIPHGVYALSRLRCIRRLNKA